MMGGGTARLYARSRSGFSHCLCFCLFFSCSSARDVVPLATPLRLARETLPIWIRFYRFTSLLQALQSGCFSFQFVQLFSAPLCSAQVRQAVVLDSLLSPRLNLFACVSIWKEQIHCDQRNTHSSLSISNDVFVSCLVGGFFKTWFIFAQVSHAIIFSSCICLTKQSSNNQRNIQCLSNLMTIVLCVYMMQHSFTRFQWLYRKLKEIFLHRTGTSGWLTASFHSSTARTHFITVHF